MAIASLVDHHQLKSMRRPPLDQGQLVMHCHRKPPSKGEETLKVLPLFFRGYTSREHLPVVPTLEHP